MNLTEKDVVFLERLKSLLESGDVWIELKSDNPSYMVLRGTYGEKIHKTFAMTRQGVRWRFQRIFGQAYVGALQAILTIELIVGTGLRDWAIRISRERYALRQRAVRSDLEARAQRERSGPAGGVQKADPVQPAEASSGGGGRASGGGASGGGGQG
jgi:uncharacterized membrane protein YgcG